MDVQRAVERVRGEFPFPGYFSEEFGRGLEFLIDAVAHEHSPPAQLLDIGCGPMDITAVFAQLGYHCSAVDDLSDPWHLAEGNRERIAGFAEAQGIRFHRHEPPDYDIPFVEGTFDVVLLNAVVEHLHESPRELLNTAFRFARAGGTVVVTMPNSVNLRKRLSVLRGQTNYPPVDGFFWSEGIWRGHVREYTLRETRWLLEEMGGCKVMASTFHSMLDRLPPRVRTPYRWLTSALPALRDSLLVLAEKPEGWKPVEYEAKRYWQAIAAGIPAGTTVGGVVGSGERGV